MTPERAYITGLEIAALVMDRLEAIGEHSDVTLSSSKASELMLAAATELGCADADAASLLQAWPRVMGKIADLAARITDEEGSRLRRNLRHFQSTRLRHVE